MLKPIVATAFAVIVVSGCSSSKLCTLVGCDSSVSLDRLLPVATDDIDKYVITMCRNATCSTAVPSIVRDPCGAGVSGCQTHVTLTLSGPLAAFPTVSGSGTADTSTDTEKFSAYRIVVVYRADTAADVAALKDGDTYSLKVSRIDGSTPAALDVTATATYTTTHPNGPDCDPTCKAATLG